jgi:hypothetical protein
MTDEAIDAAIAAWFNTEGLPEETTEEGFRKRMRAALHAALAQQQAEPVKGGNK